MALTGVLCSKSLKSGYNTMHPFNQGKISKHEFEKCNEDLPYLAVRFQLLLGESNLTDRNLSWDHIITPQDEVRSKKTKLQ